MLLRTIQKLGLLALAAATALTAVAAELGDRAIHANIPFPFAVRNQTLQPGDYEFTIDRAAEHVSIHGPNRTNEVMPFVTTLSQPQHSDSTDCHIVFDKIGETATLSEIWEPGANGVLVYATKGPHQHHILHIHL